MKILKRFGKRSIRNIPKAPTIQDVALLGYADCKPGESLYEDTFQVSRALALNGYTVIDGGGPGVMQAATLGAKSAKGKVVAVTLYPKDMVKFEGKDPKNLFDKEIKTDNYVDRTLTLLREGQVYIIFKGGTGTISEFGMAWGLARLYFGHHRPLILYGKFWHEIIRAFKKNMNLRPEELKVFKIVETPEEVLEAINDFEQEIAKGKHNHHLETKKNSYIL